jgi:hypothetical protein
MGSPEPPLCPPLLLPVAYCLARGSCFRKVEQKIAARFTLGGSAGAAPSCSKFPWLAFSMHAWPNLCMAFSRSDGLLSLCLPAQPMGRSVRAANGQPSDVGRYQAKAWHVEAALVHRREAVRSQLPRGQVAREVAVVRQRLLQRVEAALRRAQQRPRRARRRVLQVEEHACAWPQHARDLAERRLRVRDGAQHLHARSGSCGRRRRRGARRTGARLWARRRARRPRTRVDTTASTVAVCTGRASALPPRKLTRGAARAPYAASSASRAYGIIAGLGSTATTRVSPSCRACATSVCQGSGCHSKAQDDWRSRTPAASKRRARAHIVREVDARAHAELPCARLIASRPHTCSQSWVPARLRTPPPGRQRALMPAGGRRGPPSLPRDACEYLSVTSRLSPSFPA